MKSKFMFAYAGKLMAILMILGVTQTFVVGQYRDGGLSEDTYTRSIEGVWNTTVTQRNCQTGDVIRTFRGLAAYHEGGTLSETSAALGPALRSPGYGVWEKEGRLTYSSSFLFMRFLPDGTFIGTQQTTSSIALNRNGKSYETTTSIHVFDANNNQVGTGCATATATRFE